VGQRQSPEVAADRRTAIEEIVSQAGFAQVADLAAHFGRDSSTIRRDLEALAGQGRLRRVHGGAVPVDEQGLGGQDLGRTSPDARMGRAVAQLVRDGETVCLGPGSIPLAVAQALASRSRLTVVTNALEVAYWTASNTSHDVIVLGGQVERRAMGLTGQLARTALSDLRAEHVVLEAAGVSPIGGVTEDSLSQAEIARILVDTGSHIIVVVQPERVGRVAAVHVAPVSDVDVIVTAREADSSHLWDLSELGVRIVLA
jgi:DeoR/GlpR family transcriptional regulator of sugar metabolism